MLQAGAFATIINDLGEVLLCHRRDVDLWTSTREQLERGELPF